MFTSFPIIRLPQCPTWAISVVCMSMFDRLFRTHMRSSNDFFSGLELELSESRRQAANWRSFGEGIVLDVKTEEVKAQAAIDETDDLVQRAELRGEARAYRKTKALAQQRAKNLGIGLDQLS